MTTSHKTATFPISPLRTDHGAWKLVCEVPGIGPSAAASLTTNGFPTAVSLIAQFILSHEDIHLFRAWLETQGVSKTYSTITCHALQNWIKSNT